MRAPEVAALLTELNAFRWESGPNGFTILRDNCMSRDKMYLVPTARIQNGSGIAGRGGAWGIVDIKSGKSTKKITTKRELRRLLIEWLTEESYGPRPVDLPYGARCYAKLNHNSHGSSYIWVIVFPRRPENERDPHHERACLCRVTPCPCRCHSHEASHEGYVTMTRTGREGCP
jgi:hypothetical protein